MLRQLHFKAGETTDQSVARLRQQARLCVFSSSSQANEEVHDQLVTPILDIGLKKKPLHAPKLTVDKALEKARLGELAQLQASRIDPTIEANAVRSAGKSSVSGARSLGSKCFVCNCTGHFARSPQCPACDCTCRKCKKKSHFSICCKLKPDSQVGQDGTVVSLLEPQRAQHFQMGRSTQFMMQM